MTLSVENSRTIFEGDGITTVFHFPDTFMLDSEIRVFVYDPATYTETEIDPSMYSIDHPAESPFVGGDIVYPSTGSPLAAGLQLVVFRDTPLDQILDLNNQSAYFLEAIEANFDRLLRQMQEMNDEVKRCAKSSIGLPAEVNLSLGNPAPGEFIRWNEDGTALEPYPIADFASQEFIDAWHREYYSQVSEDKLLVEQGWISPGNANWNQLVTPGFYSYADTMNSGMTNTPPNLSALGMLTVSGSYGNRHQVYVNTGTNSKYARAYNNGTWTVWEPLGGMADQGEVDISGGDADDLTEVGIYYITGIGGSGTLLRALPDVACPEGILSVEKAEGNMRQHFSCLTGNPPRSFVRVYYFASGVWSVWKETTGLVAGDLEGQVEAIINENHMPIDYGMIPDASNWNDFIYPAYMWYSAAADTSQTNKPPSPGDKGILVVERSAEDALRQVYTVNTGGVPHTSIRAAYFETEWVFSNWVETGDSDLAPEWHVEYYSQVDEDNLQVEKGDILNTAQNWNNLTTPGWYRYVNSNDAGMANTPPNKGVTGILSVEVTDSIIKQIYTHSLEPLTTATRTKANNVWTEWSVDATGAWTIGETEWLEVASEAANEGYWLFDIARCWTNTRFVAVGDTALGEPPGRILFSVDGMEWYEANHYFTTMVLRGVASNGALRIVIVGYNDGSWTNSAIYTDDLGLTFNLCTTPGLDYIWHSIAYGNGRYVAVTGFESANTFMQSTDGITFDLNMLPASNLPMNRIKFANGVFIAVGNGSIIRSTNGTSFTLVYSSGTATYTGLTYGNGRWVVVSLNDGTPRLLYSDDNGLTWTAAATLPARGYVGVAYQDGLFVAAPYWIEGGTNKAITSYDGVNWEEDTASGDLDGVIATSIAAGEGLFITVGVGIEYRLTTEGSAGEVTASTVPVDTTFFDNILSSSDNTVQAALNTLDDHTHTKADITDWDHTHTADEILLPDDFEQPDGGDGEPELVYQWGTIPGFYDPDDYYWPKLRRAAFSEDLGRWVICCNQWDTVADFFFSDDTFDQDIRQVTVSLGLEYAWEDIAWGNGVFVAVATNNLDANIAYSTDGENWTFVDTSLFQLARNRVVFGNGMFLATYDTPSDQSNYRKILKSTDGINWSQVERDDDSLYMRYIAFADGLFFLNLRDLSTSRHYSSYSADGETWSDPVMVVDSSGVHTHIVAGNGALIFFSSSANTDFGWYSLDNGATFTEIDTSGFNQDYTYIPAISGFGGGDFYASGQSGTKKLYHSSDGINWTESEMPLSTTYQPASLCYGADGSWLFPYAWIDDDSVPNINGLKWYAEAAENGGTGEYVLETATGTEFPTTFHPYAVVYGDGRWVACGYGNYPDLFFYSDDDGATWTAGNYAGQDVDWYALAYGNGTFVAITYEGVTAAVAISSDGINWSDVTATAPLVGYWENVCFGNGLFVAVMDDDLNTNIATSSDGENWVRQDLGDIYYLYGVCWWDAGGMFIVTGMDYDWEYTVFFTSPDGITWTQREVDTLAAELYDVAAGETAIVASGEGVICYSNDGITWNYADDGPDAIGGWWGVAYGDGRFVVCQGRTTYPDQIGVSEDGNTWEYFEPEPRANWSDVAYGNYAFCIVGTDTAPEVVMWYRGSAPEGPGCVVETPFHAAFIEVCTNNFEGNLAADPELDTVQKCLDFIDSIEIPDPTGQIDASEVVVDDSNLDGNLAGVDPNVQAVIDAVDDLNISDFPVDTSNFDDILSPAEDTLQACLDVLDDHRHPASRITLATDGFGGILGSGQTNVQLAMEVLDDHSHEASEILPDTSGVDAGDVLTWDGSAFVWVPPPSLGTITAGDIGVDTSTFDGVLESLPEDVQTALEIIDDHGHDATDIGVITNNFDGLFSSSQNTVQKCLDVLDDLSAASIPVDVTNFDGVLSTADTVLQHALETLDDHTHPMEEILPSLDGVTSGVLGTDGETIYWADPAAGSIVLDASGFDGILDETCTEVQTAMDLLDDHYHVNNTPRCGMVDKSQSTLPLTLSSSTFILSGTYEFYVNGIRFEKTDDGVDIGSSYGYHYIWWDTDGVMQSSESPYSIDYFHAPVATVMWNGTEGVVFDQRHSSTRNADLAAMLNDTKGPLYSFGFEGTFLDDAFIIEAGRYWDEDMRYDIASKQQCRVMYRDGTNWTWTDIQDEYYIASAGVLQYDASGVLTDCPDGYYMAVWIYATADYNSPIWVLNGQIVDDTVDAARVNNDLEALSLPASKVEARLLYRVILRQEGSTPIFVESRDFRKANIISGSQIVTGDHLYLENIGTLTHPELEQALVDLEALATGHMTWMGNWVPQVYQIGDTVSDDQWTMVALTETSDRPAPQPVGDVFWVRDLVGEPDWENSDTTTNVLYIGQRYSFTDAYRISAIRTYHNAASIGLNVEIWAVVAPGTDDERIVNILPGRVLEESDLDTWQSFSIGGLYVQHGSVIDLIKVIRPSTGSVTFTHTWTYEGATGDPPSGRIYHQRGVALNEMRVHSVDSGGTDRSAELDNIGPGSTITMASGGYIWEVLSASNDGTIYTFTVDPATSASNITTDFTFLYIAPIPINYVYATDLFSGTEDVQGYFSSEYDSDEEAYLNENGYGLDIQAQNMVASDEWDVVAYPPSGSFSTGGGSGGTGGDAIDIAVDATNFDGILGPTSLNVQACLDIIDDHTHTEADITDLDKYTQTQINDMMAVKAPVIHQHTEADITDLDKYTQSEVDTLLTGKADSVHSHTEADITDLDKYTQSEVDTLLSGKSDTGHTHTESEITDLDKYTQEEMDTLLDGKADAAHEHFKRMLEIPADGDWSGTAVPMTVATDGGAFALHYVNASGQLAPIDADSDTTMPAMFLVLAAGTGSQNALVEGFVTNSGWSWTPGGILYASTTAGAMTQTAPSGVGDQVQTVGIAITATTILFKPDLVIAEIGIFG